MELRTRLRPPYALLFIVDVAWADSDVAIPQGAGVVVANEACIVVKTRIPQDGDTSIAMTSKPPTLRTEVPKFDGTLRTPSLRVRVETAEAAAVLEMATADAVTRVRIWTNEEGDEPSEVLIVLGEA